MSVKLVPTYFHRGCHVVSVTDPYGRILDFLDRTCCVNLLDNNHYASINTTPLYRTKHFTRKLAQSTPLEHLQKVYTRTLEHALQLNIRTMHFTKTLAKVFLKHMARKSEMYFKDTRM
jgi:hypothetical protein